MRPCGKPPVAFRRKTVSAEFCPIGRLKLVNILENSVPAFHRRAKQHYACNSSAVNNRLDVWVSKQRLYFRGENNSPVVCIIKQRLYAYPVTAEKQFLFGIVPNRKGVNAVEPFGAAFAPFHIGMKQHLRVGMTIEDMPSRQQITADFLCVVQLAVVADYVLSAVLSGAHWLLAVFGVNDDKPAVGEKALMTFPHAALVGAPWSKQAAHLVHYHILTVQITVKIHPSCNSTHKTNPFFLLHYMRRRKNCHQKTA